MQSSFLRRARRMGTTHHLQGFSVVELMVAVAIGLFILAGVVQVVVTSKRNYLDQEEMSFIQNNARYTVDALSREIKMAGYMGCVARSSAHIANSIDDDAGGFIGTQGIIGFEGEAGTTNFPIAYRANAVPGTDSFLVRRAANDNEVSIRGHNAAAAVIDVWESPNYPSGKTLVIADANCRYMGLFQVSHMPSTDKIGHNSGGGGGNLANNCTKIIKGNFDCSQNCQAVSCGNYTKATGQYGAGTKLMEFIAHAYYIGESTSTPGSRALMRQSLTTDTTGATTVAEELVAGVEDMELMYGVDTDEDGQINQYRKASDMDVNSDGTIDGRDWDTVLAVRMNLLFRSRGEVFLANQTMIFDGAEVISRHLRQAVTANVQIRNRG